MDLDCGASINSRIKTLNSNYLQGHFVKLKLE